MARYEWDHLMWLSSLGKLNCLYFKHWAKKYTFLDEIGIPWTSVYMFENNHQHDVSEKRRSRHTDHILRKLDKGVCDARCGRLVLVKLGSIDTWSKWFGWSRLFAKAPKKNWQDVCNDHSSSSHLISLLSSSDFIENEVNKFVAFQEFGQIRIGAENLIWEQYFIFSQW